MRPIDRREFLAALAQAGIGSLALASLPAWAKHALAAPGAAGVASATSTTGNTNAIGADIIVRNDRPEHWETSIAALARGWITPNDVFFVRSHLSVPEVDAASHRLEISGLVRDPFSLALGELRAMPAVEAVHTLECAGNGRGLYRLPSTSGTQWGRGAVGNAAWGGIRLATLLERAGAAPEAKHVWFEAADRAPMPQAPPFLRSIPLAKAMDDVLVVHAMNGAPLPRLHGGPLRVIVPGWYGMASTKWVTRVRIEDHPSDGHFMAKGYRYVYPGEDTAQAPPVEETRIKSLIVQPLDGARIAAGPIVVRGFAWAGSAGVASVEVSSDGGKTWHPATLEGDARPLAWREWSARLPAASRGVLTFMARATDGAGEIQPLEARPNASGYANNSIHRVTVHVRA